MLLDSYGMGTENSTLARMLVLMKRTETERVCRDVLQDLVEDVAEKVDREHVTDLLQSMGHMRATWHYMEVQPVESLMRTGTSTGRKRFSLMPRDFLATLSDAAKGLYRQSVCLRTDPLCLALETKGQAHNSRWHEERRLRISSSTAHPIRTRRGKFKELAVRMASRTTFCSAGMKYGIATEARARQLLQEQLAAQIAETGLVVMCTQPWLCCSPDGLVKVGDDIMVTEIKCPHRCRNTAIVDDTGKSSVEYLELEDGQVALKKSHAYNTQIQVQLYILNLSKAILFVYSPKQSVTVIVARDDSFLSELIAKLEYFYFTYLINELS
ncbi:uncharacterized protein LOC135375377 isoform X2 [Ornithodoros turicata]